MGFYERHCLPRLLNCACSMKPVAKQRQRVVPQASGRVLEVGMGSGLNLPFYDPSKVDFIWGLEPAAAMRETAARRVQACPVEVRWLAMSGESIALEDNSADTVLLTYTLCTIPDWRLALQEMRRVLKPGGHLIFCEHGQAPDESVRRWQNRLDGLWGKIAGGCHLNRDIPALIEDVGLKIEAIQSAYLPGPKFAAFTYWGHAV